MENDEIERLDWTCPKCKVKMKRTKLVDSGFEIRAWQIAERNDILISVRAPVWEVNISLSKVCIGRGLAAIRCKPDKTNYQFLLYFSAHFFFILGKL